MALYIDNFEKKRLKIKALGGFASGDVTGQLMIVKDLDELQQRHKEVKVRRKIVLFNSEFTNYSNDVANGLDGPSRASYFGAVAALVRSLTPFSLGNIHVGMTGFEGVKPIPAGSISIEDAVMLDRLTQNEVVIMRLVIKNRAKGKKTVSHNLIADIPDRSDPENYTILSRHIDSWDVGKGVLDDGGGSCLALHSLLLLKNLLHTTAEKNHQSHTMDGGRNGVSGS